MTEKGEKGVIYISADDSYLDEAIRSVESLKEHNPEVKATLYTDEENLECEVFDQIKHVNYSIEETDDSIIKPFMTPYEKNLYLDTDTYITGDISELFEILEYYQIAACLAPGRKRVIETPGCVREYNTGVIAFRGTNKIRKIFEKWSKCNEEILNKELEVGKKHDQHPFAKTIFESDIEFFTLPPEYNTRIPRCGYAAGEVKIIHGRPKTSMEKIEKTINQTEKSRVHYASQNLIGSGRKIKFFSKAYAIQNGIKILYSEGPSRLKNKVLKYLKEI
jgi:hypothetical protein